MLTCSVKFRSNILPIFNLIYIYNLNLFESFISNKSTELFIAKIFLITNITVDYSILS